MVNDPSAARDNNPDAPSEEDFQAFLAALSGSARGRAFLAEHARRSRSEDSAMLLSAVQRLESLVLSQTPPAAGENPTDELRGMLETIRSVQAELDVSMLAAQVANLAALIQNVQERIETMVAPAEAAPPQDTLPEDAPPQDTAEEPIALDEPSPADADVAPEAAPETESEAEATEPEAEPEPEAPADDIATPAPEAGIAELPEPEAVPVEASEPPLPEAMPEDAWPSIPEVAWCDSDTSADDAPVEEAPVAETALAEPALAEAAVEEKPAQDAPAEEAPVEAAAVDETSAAIDETPVADAAPTAALAITALVETLVVPSTDDTAEPTAATVIKAGTIPPPKPFAGEDFTAAARPRTMPPEIDPLADIKALSDDERVALFT